MAAPSWVSQVIEKLFPAPQPGGTIELPFRIEHGEFTTAEARTYRISFSKPYPKAPTVLCAGSIRAGKVSPPAIYTAPSVTPPAAISPAQLSSTLLKSLTDMVPGLAIPPSISVPSIDTIKDAVNREWTSFRFSEVDGKVRESVEELGRQLNAITEIKNRVSDLITRFIHPNGPICPSIKWIYDSRVVDLTGKRLFEYPDPARRDRTCLWYIVDNLTGREMWSDNIASACQKNMDFFRAVIDSVIGEPLQNLKNAVERLEASLSRIKDALDRAWSTICKAKDIATTVLDKEKAEIQDKLSASLTELRDKWTQLRDGTAAVISRYNSEIQSSINAFNTDLRRFSDAIGDRLMKQYSEIREGMGRLSAQAYDSVDKAIKGLYQMTGVREGVLLVPVAISRVDASGFEIEGVPGGRYWWMAIGAKS